jgi:hypothetical protein
MQSSVACACKISCGRFFALCAKKKVKPRFWRGLKKLYKFIIELLFEICYHNSQDRFIFCVAWRNAGYTV